MAEPKQRTPSSASVFGPKTFAAAQEGRKSNSVATFEPSRLLEVSDGQTRASWTTAVRETLPNWTDWLDWPSQIDR